MTSDGSISTPPPPNEPAEAKPFYKRWWFIVIATIVGLGLLGSIFGDPDESTTAADTTTTTEEVDTTTTSTAEPTTTTEQATTTTTTAEPTGPQPAFGSGTQVVGEDVQPGIYETAVLEDGVFDGCYWERLSGFSGDFEEIIANNNVVVHDVVEIAASDVGFDSDCSEWFAPSHWMSRSRRSPKESGFSANRSAQARTKRLEETLAIGSGSAE